MAHFFFMNTCTFLFGETLVYGFWPLLYFWPLLDLWALLYFWAFLLVWPRYILNSFGVWCFLYSFVLWPLLFYELFQKKCVRFLTFFIWSFFVPFYFCFHIHSVFMFCIFMIFFRYCYDTIFRPLFLLAEHREGGWYQSCYNSKITKQWISDCGWRRQGDERGTSRRSRGSCQGLASTIDLPMPQCSWGNLMGLFN